MKEIGPTAGIGCKNTITDINFVEGIDCQSIAKITTKERIIIHYNFRTMEIGENIKIYYKEKYRNENFYNNDKSYDMDSSCSRDREYDRNRSFNRDNWATPGNTTKTIVEIGPIAEIYNEITMKEIDPTAGIDCKNKTCRRDRSPEYYKNNYEREYYHTFQYHGNRRKIKTSL